MSTSPAPCTFTCTTTAMFIDSDSEEWSTLALPRVQRVDWPADAPAKTNLLFVQPMSGPLTWPKIEHTQDAIVVPRNQVV
jgi:hypothetical protein